MLPKPLTIATTGLNAIDSPGPGVAVIRSLKEGFNEPIKIIGLAYENLEPGIYMKNICDVTYQISYPAAGAEVLYQSILNIHQQEQIDIIIPNFDAELQNFIFIANRLKQLGIHTFMPTIEMFNARDKQNLFHFGQTHHLKVPIDFPVYSLETLYQAGEKLGYPMVVKGKFYEAEVCYTYEQAQKAFYKISAKWGLPIIAQQFIAGTEVNVAALGDGEGNAISIVPMRKMYITDKGKAWAGISIEDEGLLNLTKKFVEVSKWRGGFELEIMKTNNNDYYIMEINPRFPAWIYFATAVGQNQPAALVNLALGKKVQPYKQYQAGKLFIRYAWDMIVDVTDYQQFTVLGKYQH